MSKVYSLLISLPAKLFMATAALCTIVPAVLPDLLPRRIGEPLVQVSPSWLLVALLTITTIYFILLWHFKPVAAGDVIAKAAAKTPKATEEIEPPKADISLFDVGQRILSMKGHGKIEQVSDFIKAEVDDDTNREIADKVEEHSLTLWTREQYNTARTKLHFLARSNLQFNWQRNELYYGRISCWDVKLSRSEVDPIWPPLGTDDDPVSTPPDTRPRWRKKLHIITHFLLRRS